MTHDWIRRITEIVMKNGKLLKLWLMVEFERSEKSKVYIQTETLHPAVYHHFSFKIRYSLIDGGLMSGGFLNNNKKFDTNFLGNTLFAYSIKDNIY